VTAVAPLLPELWGGSADLAGANNTTPKGEPSFLPEDRQTKSFSGGPYGRVLHFGVREHAIGAIVKGFTHHYLRGYGTTPAVELCRDNVAPALSLQKSERQGRGTLDLILP